MDVERQDHRRRLQTVVGNLVASANLYRHFIGSRWRGLITSPGNMHFLGHMFTPAQPPDCRKIEWCPGAELNHRHLHFQCSALPTELPGPTHASRMELMHGLRG